MVMMVIYREKVATCCEIFLNWRDDELLVKHLHKNKMDKKL